MAEHIIALKKELMISVVTWRKHMSAQAFAKLWQIEKF